MTSNPLNDRTENPPVTGQTGARTGFDTPDPKDNSAKGYTETPAVVEEGVGHYQAPEVEPAKAVTGPLDHLATRDVEAMEKAPQAPEFAGAQTVAGLGNEVLETIVPGGSLNTSVAQVAAVESRERTIDPNPQYTPPSDMGPPHQSERPADLPEGETPEIQYEVQGDGVDRG